MSVYNFEVENNEGINGFTSINIFNKGGSDEIWGNSNLECNPLSFSSKDASIDYTLFDNSLDDSPDTVMVDVKYDLPVVKVKDRRGLEKNSIHLKTSKPTSCEWIGMGIGWDAWQGKDISGIINSAAIEFMAMVDGDPIYNIPIVFILEDYSANQCYATAGYLGVEGGMVTQKWTRVIIPLPTFSYQTNNIDLTNIKQLLLQCYDKVDVYIDDIKIVYHDHNYKRINESLTVSSDKYPIDIFSENLTSSWGINSKYCSNIMINNNPNYNGGEFIDVRIDQDECNWREFAISWNNWLYTDLSDNIYGVFLEFDINLDNQQGIDVAFEDYDGNKMSLDLTSYLGQKNEQSWETIRIPMKHFPIKKSSIDLKRIKDIIFTFEDKTRLKIDNIKLTN